jgi:hypothetical protein
MRILVALFLLAVIGVVGYTQHPPAAPNPPHLHPESTPAPPGFTPPTAGKFTNQLVTRGDGHLAKLQPSVLFSGTHSAIRMRLLTVVHHERGWKELWEHHRGTDRDPPFTERSQALAINFESQFVVAVFTGDDSALDVTTFTRGDAVLVRFKAHGVQTEGRYPGQVDPRSAHQKAKDEAVADYCFVVLPRPAKTIVIEEDVRRQLGDPPVWRERVRFSPPADNE